MDKKIEKIIEKDTGKSVEEIRNSDWKELEKNMFLHKIFIFFDKILFLRGGGFINKYKNILELI